MRNFSLRKKCWRIYPKKKAVRRVWTSLKRTVFGGLASSLKYALHVENLPLNLVFLLPHDKMVFFTFHMKANQVKI